MMWQIPFTIVTLILMLVNLIVAVIILYKYYGRVHEMNLLIRASWFEPGNIKWYNIVKLISILEGDLVVILGLCYLMTFVSEYFIFIVAIFYTLYAYMILNDIGAVIRFIDPKWVRTYRKWYAKKLYENRG